MSPAGVWRKPWLWLPAKIAHDLSPFFLNFRSLVAKPVTYQWRAFSWRGLEFKNRLGLAGGVDKNGESLPAWWSFGVGFVEIGTVTPKPQSPNPGKIIARDPSRLALWNKMGFPSAGMEEVAANLEKLGRPYYTPVFINIGKNRETPNERASEDYVACLNRLHAHADAFVINISSPNTKGLRDLLQPQNLRGFLKPIIDARDKQSRLVPLILKLSPDLSDDDLANALDVGLELNLDGWIVSNTTLSREEGMTFSNEGGVSGGPLTGLAREVLKKAASRLGSRKGDRLLISAGGVMTPEEVRERLDLGADLIQVYSALIFEGPGFFKQVARKLYHS